MITSNDTLTVSAWQDYFTLLKPRVMSLVVFTGLCGLLAAPGHIGFTLGFTAILCIAVGAGASGALNMYIEADSDALMVRTSKRPLPDGRVPRNEALAFAIGLAVASVIIMGLAVNLVAAGLLLGSILFYVFVYTVWLKRRTPQNIVIGGAAGAFPPVIGWAAVTGDTTLLPWLLFALIFLWTPPHFWAMALFSQTDYARAGIPMLPVVAGEKTTRNQIFYYSLAMVACSLAPWLFGYTSKLYGYSAVVLGGVFIGMAYTVWQDARAKAPKDLFKYSILYLFLLFAVLAADRVIINSSPLAGEDTKT